MFITLFDYGAGNLHSLQKALEMSGDNVRLESDPVRAVKTDMLVLPGVGAFGMAASRLAPGRDVVRAALQEGLPCLGICLGMQLLFDASDEGEGEGLGIFPGRVTRLRASRVPQIGWNRLEYEPTSLLARSGLSMAYFANGYACRPVKEDCVIAWSTHDDDRFPAAVRVGNVAGVQFHPEKSSAPGVRFLHEFLAEARSGTPLLHASPSRSAVSIAGDCR